MASLGRQPTGDKERKRENFASPSSVLGWSRRDRALGLLDNGGKGGRLVDRQIGQHLAVNQQAGFAEPVDEPAVGEAEWAHGRIEPLDPQGAEGALAPL